jgi:uncharacterized protein with HEPN domain
MYSRKPSVIIQDILTGIEHIKLYTKNISFDEFASNFMLTEACLYNLQVIGEAVSNLPMEIKEEYKDIPWSLIKGTRNRLIHEYFGTDIQVIWNIIEHELPLLLPELQKIYSLLINQGN